ncbi:relaxase/mobilization nuclease domain-containing protein [Dyadobacter fermentans]|uniref:Relaxase/mobilization nuclease family protein n=1 Tax=Dyadobacter fermentans (strain ATCC 700827 / DSM 18053 / CIP 107007 / KCTC 52180 / NS114) TaxID=471854 RepID=C6W0U4_DYAFD|nr:relaxase/mobilization nuclease domain-containing protein [Dyadobacter fermentans]ACT95399.1 Relaxase/mobilization nuclease family protein [Dyadobacter fermentans DSM 18053]
MVAVIHTSSRLRAVLHYNENKLEQGHAECISAFHYPKDADALTFEQKLNRIQRQLALNKRTKVNTVHISLNFDPSEKLKKEKLAEISKAYLKGIGFEKQPALVYEHRDAGHPHVHIVTTNIKADGSRISLHNLGKNQSEKTRKEIEIGFGLVKAQESKGQEFRIQPASIKVEYGKIETKKAISNVLSRVIKDYKFTTIGELNAVLNLFNVAADIGSQDSRIRKNKGILYRILDKDGNKVGVPIKASDFHFQPTQQNLQKLFVENEVTRQIGHRNIKNSISMVMYGQKNPTLPGLSKNLRRDGIDMVLRRNEQGVLYGITFIDHRSKAVFNGSALGKEFGAKGITEWCRDTDLSLHQQRSQMIGKNAEQAENQQNTQQASPVGQFKNGRTAVDALFSPLQDNGYTPQELRKPKKKKQRGFSMGF